ncbi:signal transduction histidine kinase [Lysobacter niabensis]|uniref:histidine kinase n=1 Tax=Agrilutibacter niabensis TaxID=380628 RepID=A0ABU1VL35_9GAMM|nr:HAMP domain-containing sensor histidine kinase [Lysobacter niabensis]MDR7097903.1 signal transduction histidine kinase [Lysobacter niabensis]
MPQGLPRRIKLAFIAQALVASVVLCLFLLAIGLAVRQSVVNWAAHREATRFWTEVAAQSSEALPRSRAFDSYFIPAGSAPDALPPAMRGFPPGLKQVALSRFVYVEERRQGRFVLSIDTTLIDTAILVTVLVTLLFALGLSYVMAWMTYRTTKRMVVPVSWLADVVAWWDPRAPDTSAVRASRLPPDSGSEVHQLASALAGLGDRVTDFVQRERDFTRDASHELRTPLTVIRVATDLMLADPDASDRQLRSLARVQRAGRDMEAVIDAFLILAREAEVEPLSEEFDVREVVAHEVARVQPLLVGRPIELAVIDEGTPKLFAPPHVLAVMIGNLLGNAVRFTDSGRIELHLAPERIEVRDTGIGMTPEALMKAFDPFYRADHAREEGRGMGLSIVRRLGDRFDWPVSLESQPGKGTTAIIRFA